MGGMEAFEVSLRNKKGLEYICVCDNQSHSRSMRRSVALYQILIVMSKALVICVTLVLSCGYGPAFSQHSTGADSISFVYAMWNSEQRKAMLLHMDLTESEKSSFVPVYDAYSRAVSALEIERVQLIDLYLKHFRQLNEDEILKIYEKMLRKDFEVAKVRILYYRKIRKVLSGAQANEFMALDESLRTLFHLELQKDAPALALSKAAIFSMNARYNTRK